MEREFIGVKQNFGAAGCPFGSRTAVTVASSTSVVIAAGAWVVETDSHTTVRFSYNSGSNFITWIGTSSVGMIYSDGFNVEFRGDSTGGTGEQTQLLALA